MTVSEQTEAAARLLQRYKASIYSYVERNDIYPPNWAAWSAALADQLQGILVALEADNGKRM